MASENQKLKLLYLLDIFRKETDESHGLTRQEITDLLAEKDIKVERKTFYYDIACLQKFGFNILKFDERPTKYGLVEREFENPELMLMADAVQSSKLLTEAKAKKLTRKIAGMGGKYVSKNITKRIHVEGRITSQNESVYYHLDTIQQALRQSRKIEFTYFKYDLDKKPVLSHNGDLYVKTPVQLMYMDGYYYLIVWDDKHVGFGTYRIDRMKKVEVSQLPATVNEQIKSFDVSKFQERVFNMFSGEPVNVKLRVQEWAMTHVVDRFGKNVSSQRLNDHEAEIDVTVMEAPPFYAWLAGYGDGIVIEKPASIREAYLEYLRKIAAAYEEQL